MHLIPLPETINPLSGTCRLDTLTHINLVDHHYLMHGKTLQQAIAKHTGIVLPIIASLKPFPQMINLIIGTDPINEAYSLTITSEIITCSGASPRGLFWSIQTLSQIVSQQTILDCCEIIDQPEMANRGFYHDITRGKVPTLATLKHIADSCARFKINQLQLYIEHTFAFRNVVEHWAGKDPITAQEILELDVYCKERYIELVPSLSTFGHLYELIRQPRYQHLNELDMAASEVPYDLYDRMGHYTLDVLQPESFSLVKTMIEEYLPLFSSNLFNICCDETMDLGKGKNKDYAEKHGEGRLYVDFVKKIMEVVLSHGKTPMFWGDIILHHPELIDQIPKQAIFLNWAYNGSVTEEGTATFAKAKVTQYVCPGVDAWSRFTANVDNASENIRKMVTYGHKYSALGMLNTDWGDCGHINLLAHTWNGMIFGAALSWNSASYSNNNEFDVAVSKIHWHDTTGTTASLMRTIGSLPDTYNFQNIYAWLKGHSKSYWDAEERIKNAPYSSIANSFLVCTTTIRQLNGLLVNTQPENRQDYSELIWGTRALRFSYALCAYKKMVEFRQNDCALLLSKDRLLTEGHAILNEYLGLWRMRNKESELQVIIDVFTNLFKRLQSL